MKIEIPLRIVVKNPLPEVSMQVQRGKNELLPPALVSKEELIFEFDISVDVSGNAPNFLGKYAQGPKQDRFVYVNSGTYAGQQVTCWSRRAKISLMSISKGQVEETISSPKKCLEATFNGTGKDGGPTCATVKNLIWAVTKK